MVGQQGVGGEVLPLVVVGAAADLQFQGLRHQLWQPVGRQHYGWREKACGVCGGSNC